MTRVSNGIFETSVIRYSQYAGTEYDLSIFVDYTYHPAQPGCTYRRNGDPGYPPEPSWVEIRKAHDYEGVPVTLARRELDDIEQQIIDKEES